MVYSNIFFEDCGRDFDYVLVGILICVAIWVK